MQKNNFWFFSLFALLIIGANIDMNIYIRIALILNAVIVFIDSVRRLVQYGRNRKEA